MVVTAGEGAFPLWYELQDELAALSSNSAHRAVAGATHMSLVLDREDAQITSTAILEVVDAARSGQPLALLTRPRTFWARS